MKYKEPQRIVIIGSAGTGKTTLVEKLRKKLKLKFIPEQARIICSNLGYKNIYEIKDCNSFRFKVLKSQIILEEKLNRFISDRSTIDCWAHWIRWSINSAKSEDSEKYFNQAKTQALKYSHIIYIPRTIKPRKDGFRWNNKHYQNQIDRLIRETLLDWELMHKTHIVQSTNINERVKEILPLV